MTMLHEETEQRYQQLLPKIEAVADELGMKVIDKKPKDERRYNVDYTLVNASNDEKIGIHLITYGASRGRLSIHGHLPPGNLHNPSEYLPRGMANPDITVAMERTPSQIAGEIVRRLLPGYRECCKSVRSAVEAEKKSIAFASSVEQRLAGIFKNSQRFSERMNYSRDSYGVNLPKHAGTDIQISRAGVDDASVTLTFRYLSPDEAEKILRLYDKMFPNGRE